MDRIKVNFAKGDRPKSDPGRTITLFLSLYLLVLAFFILLVSISSTEQIKSKALMDSLSSTFSSVLPPRTDITTFNATTGDFLASEDFQKQVTGLFSTVIGVEKVEVVQPGRIMRIELQGSSLFEIGSEVVREGQFPFMDRLVASLSANPPGIKFEMEFVVPLTWNDDNFLPTEQSLSIKRAGSFAREMLKRGAPPGAVSIGVNGHANDNIEIWFHTRTIEENRIRFEESPLIQVNKPKETQILLPKYAPVTLQPLGNTASGSSFLLPQEELQNENGTSVGTLNDPNTTPEEAGNEGTLNQPLLLVPRTQNGDGQ